MGDFFVLNNCRRFPRAKLRCDVVYRDRVQSWRGHTEDISFGGCRLSGYYPFALGKPLSLMLTHPSIDEPMVVIGKVACLYGGAQNAIGLAFLNQWRGTSVEDWIRKLIAKDPEALRAGARVPNHLPIEAQLHRAPQPPVQRVLSPAEAVLMQKLAGSVRAVSLRDLRTEWGNEWERKARVVFDLMADGIIQCSLPQPGNSLTIVPEFR